MSQSQLPIDHYIGELAVRLDMSAAERGVILQEIRAHLEDVATRYMEEGAEELTAQCLAVETFGDVRRLGRRLSRRRFTRWNGRRWARGIGAGAALSWAIWTFGTFPVMLGYYTGHETPQPSPSSILMQSTPVASGAFYAYLTLGWKWLLPLLLLYALVPFLWGRRAYRWWTPGLAYGLGTWLAAPWAILYWFLWNTGDWAFQAEASVVTLAAPLAMLASLLGWLWRRRMDAPQTAPAELAA